MTASVFTRLRVRLANRVPSLGLVWRWVTGTASHWSPVRRTYSQHGEDLDLLVEWRKLRPGAARGIYVDVGANHPSRLSNTYLLYRQGWSGVTIEPNLHLVHLHRRFRPRDAQLPVACASSASVRRFSIASAPVLSTFNCIVGGEVSAGSVKGVHIIRTEFVPMLPLDTLLAPFEHEEVDILSIDAEGFDLEVLRGASRTLEKTLLLIVEAGTPDDERAILSHLDGRFIHVKTCGCNLLLRRSDVIPPEV
jgi:FkbM family methyltransferase